MTDGPAEHRIDDLARLAGTTVRNVRAYQDRGLLPSPRRQGRVAWYDDAHLARLRLIGSLLERGFSLANIAELVDGWQDGRNLGDVLGFGAQLTGPFTDEVPDVGTLEDLVARYGLAVDDQEASDEVLRLGLIELDGDLFRVPSPRLLRAGIELYNAGIPAPALFAELRRIRAEIEVMAERLLRLVMEEVFEPMMVDGRPVPGTVGELTEKIARIRPLATTVVSAELARALQNSADAELGARVRALLAATSAEPAG